MMQRETPTNDDVEVITTDDFWAGFGPALPDSNKMTSQPKAEYQWYGWRTRTVAALLTFAIHAVLISTMLPGSAGRPPVKPLNEGELANGKTKDATEFVSVILLLEEHSITPPDQQSDDSAYSTPEMPELLAKDSALLTSAKEPKPPEISGSDNGTDKDSPTAEAIGDDAGRAMLFGRYMGQIKARIERVWEQPDDSSSELFDCKVQIKQNSRGEVQEVTLQRCSDDPSWQVSLVQAIQRASPLSAPPSDTVFSNVISLSFTGRLSAR